MNKKNSKLLSKLINFTIYIIWLNKLILNMSSINFRLYGDQIYGLASKYLTEYITPDINKEEFTTNFKNGFLNLNITGIKKPITILPHISINDLKTEKIEISIPDDKTNFILKMSKFKIMLLINELTDVQIESLIIEKRKKLVEKFIKETINKIEKKKKSSFLSGLLDSLVKRALNGLIIEMKDIEVYMKYNNHLFLLKIDNIIYNENEGIKINDISIVYNDKNKNENKTNIVKSFNIGIIINGSKDNSLPNSLKINFTDIYFEINSNMYMGIMSIIKIINDINYKKRYLRYKKLIDYSKPKKTDDKKLYYTQLWYWSIKSVIKLQKYKSKEKFYIFDLLNSTQQKISKKYINSLDNKDNDNNNLINESLILPDEIKLLQTTKEKVEKQLLENKKGNQLVNAFNFFFGGNADDEKKKELTEEEKQSLDNAYTDESIINYISKKKYDKNIDNNNENEEKKEEEMIDKMKNFFNNISFNVTLSKIEILLNYFYAQHSVYLTNINTIININKENNIKNFQFIIKDIGYDGKYSIFNNIIKDKENEKIKFIKNNDIFEIIFGFNTFEINDKIVLFIINFYFSLFYLSEENQNTFFVKQKLKKKDEKIKNYFSIIDRIKIPFIPSIHLISNNNNSSILINIINFIIDKTSISFKINAKDNNSNAIIENYEIKIIKNEENTKFNLALNEKLRIIIPTHIADFMFLFFWEIKKLQQHYQIIQHIRNISQNNKKILLYGFTYKVYKTLKVEDSLLNKFDFNLFINSLLIEINEKSGKTCIIVKNLTLTYNKKNLLFKLDLFNLILDKNAPIFLYVIKLKSPNIEEFENLLSQIIKKDYNLDINGDLLKKHNISNQIIQTYIYQKKKVKLINQLISSFKAYLTEIKINYISNKIIFSFFLNKTMGEKTQNNSFIFKTESSYFNYKNSNINNNIMELKENLFFDFNYMNNGLELKVKSPNLFINGQIIELLKENFNLKIDKKRLRGILKKLKIKAEIKNTSIIDNKFIFNLSNVDIKNYYDLKENNNNLKKNTVFVKITTLQMKRKDNKPGLILMKENEIKLEYRYNPKTNKNLNIQTSELNMMLSQEDLYYLVLFISDIYLYLKKSINKKNIITEPENINNIDVHFSLPIFNLSLFTNNNYKKIGELSIASTRFIIRKVYNENINKSNEYIKQLNYSLLINKILIKYIDINENELVLLKSGNDKNNKNMNHIELYCQNKKNIEININKNYIIVRGDSFFSLYHYFKKALPLKEIKNKLLSMNNNSNNKNLVGTNLSKMKINFEYTKFLIPSTFNANENLTFNVGKFIIVFNSINNSKFPNGTFGITISSISSIITSNNITRKLFYTDNEFLSVNIKLIQKNLNLMVALNSLIINLSYTDITTFLRVYYLNKILIENEKKLLSQSNNYMSMNNNQHNKNYFHRISQRLKEKSISFSGSFNFENFNITLIDNSSGSYYPFANLRINKIYLECQPNHTINSYFSLLLSSYNYISCVWEPTIENTMINFNYQEKNNNNKNKFFEIIINGMNTNISDMSISFTLSSLNNWIKKLIEDKNNYKNNEYGIIGNGLIDFKTSLIQSINMTKITNNKLINHTGIKLCIKYANNTYYCEPFSSIELEYINEWDVKIYGPKELNLAVDNQTNFFIPIERICTRVHTINNILSIVSENTLSKDRQININVYSPVIFKNKSLYKLKVNVFNQQKGNGTLYLEQNSCVGLPLYYYDPNTYFNFTIPDANQNLTSENYTLSEIVAINNNQKYAKNININNTILLMSLSHKIPKVKTILINCEYMILNCLPCNIGMRVNGRNYIINKCSQQYLDFYSGNDSDIGIQITANNTTFFSNPKKLFQKQSKEKGTFLKFKNSDNKDCFRLSLLIHKKDHKKIIAIYAESILENKSGVDFYINSKNICFQISENLYLISSKINVKDSSFTINNDFYNYYSKNINLGDILHASPSYILDLKTTNNNYNKLKNQIQLIIDNSMSNITLNNEPTNKYNIISMIYRIYSSYRITNLLSTKNFIIASQENPGDYIIINPMTQINFDFFHKGVNTPIMFCINNLSNNTYNNFNNFGKFTSPFTLKEIGTYTFSIGDNMFNLEITKSSSRGIIDVFVVETNFDNAKIIIENFTNNIFSIYQQNYDSYNQIIEANNKHILNIYDQNCMKFYFQYGSNSKGEFEFKPLELQQKKLDLGNNIIMCLESNGIKMKISFYDKSILDKNEDFTENINFDIKINEVMVSLIGDNEFKNKKLRNYERKEILLLEINQLFLQIKWDKNVGLLGKDIIMTNLLLENLTLYNQSKNIQYINAFYNQTNPCLWLQNKIFHFKNDNVWKIGGFSLQLGNLKLNIDPVFIEEMMDFINNIIYRMKIKNYNVDKIFLVEENFNNSQSINLNAYQDKIKEYIELYNKKGLVFHGDNFDLPQLKLIFEISNNGLEHLLINKFNISRFYVMMAKGLTERQHSINLDPYTIPLYIGDFKGIFKLILQRYKNSLKSQFINIGIKGFFGNITKLTKKIDKDFGKKIGNKINKLFNNQKLGNIGNFLGVNQKDIQDIFDMEDSYNELSYDNQKFNRKRIQRAFYGKFKYFKAFNQDDAYYFDIIPQRLSNTGMQFIFTNLVKGSNTNLYVFTNSALLMMTANIEVYNTIYYFCIANVNWNNNQIYINFNQNIDGRNYLNFCVENENVAHIVCNILMEETAKNKDNFKDI